MDIMGVVYTLFTILLIVILWYESRRVIKDYKEIRELERQRRAKLEQINAELGEALEAAAQALNELKDREE